MNYARYWLIDWEKTNTTYAIVNKNGWHQQGDMLWFGVSSNVDADWENKWRETLKQCNPDDLVVMVDLHI